MENYRNALIGVVVTFLALVLSLYFYYLFTDKIILPLDVSLFLHYVHSKYLIVFKILFLFSWIPLCFLYGRFKESKINKIVSFLLSISFIGLFLLCSYTSLYIYLELPSLLCTTFFSSHLCRGMNSKIKDLEQLGADNKQKENTLSIQTNSGYFNIPNPFRGILGIGGAGAGKSASLVRPIFRQSFVNHYSIYCYDYKFPDLTEYCYTHLKQRKELHKLRVINFVDLSRTHRVNPIALRYISSVSEVVELVEIIVKNLMDSSEHGTFWYQSFVSYLTSIVIYLRNNHPEKCTIPYVVSIGLDARIEAVVKMLCTDVEAKDRIVPLKVVVDNQAGGQLSGVIGTVSTYLNRINSKEIFYVLSGDEVELQLNYNAKTANRKDNMVLCVGNDSSVESAISPILALISQVVIKANNVEQKSDREREGRIPLLYAIDEFPTMQLMNIEQLPATGRSRKIVTFLLAQDTSQIDRDYGRNRRDTIVANCANQFFGNCANIETNQLACNIFGKREYDKISENVSSSPNEMSSQSMGKSTAKDFIVEAHEIMQFPPGLFLAKLVDTDNVFYKDRIKYVEEEIEELPPFRQVETEAINALFAEIKTEAVDMVSAFVEETEFT